MKRWVIVAVLWLAIGCVSSDKFFNNEVGKRKENQITVTENSLDFIVIGDWGKKGMHRQMAVARALGNAAQTLNTNFIITAGDNFYYNGVDDIKDPHWKYSFEEVYVNPSLQRRWYAVLGNHDYNGNADAQIEYSKISHRWYMPSRYYSEKFPIHGDSTNQVLVAFIDTNPFIKSYYTDKKFQQSLKHQDSTLQKQWLDSVLGDASSSIKWKIVIGHHPVTTGGRRVNTLDVKDLNKSLTPIFKKHKVDAVIAGHDHHLEHTKPAGETHYFISGAGSVKRSASLNPDGGLYAVSDEGFIAFSIMENKMKVQIINEQGRVLYRTEIHK
jgi:hypothetical protein